jgi:hypothetical protein
MKLNFKKLKKAVRTDTVEFAFIAMIHTGKFEKHDLNILKQEIFDFYDNWLKCTNRLIRENKT